MPEIIENPRFKSLSSRFQDYIDNNRTGGIVCLIYHKGQRIYTSAHGWRDKEQKIPITTNTIFRIYSMTKPIVCLALLTLYEQGKFELSDKVSNYIPQFKNSKVLKVYNKETGQIEFEDLTSPITIEHLLTHTAGFTYVWFRSFMLKKSISKNLNSNRLLLLIL